MSTDRPSGSGLPPDLRRPVVPQPRQHPEPIATGPPGDPLFEYTDEVGDTLRVRSGADETLTVAAADPDLEIEVRLPPARWVELAAQLASLAARLDQTTASLRGAPTAAAAWETPDPPGHLPAGAAPAGATLPDVEDPDVEAPPDVKAPGVKAPDVKAPDVKAPDVKAPDVNQPDAEKRDPGPADIEVTDTEVPGVEVPGRHAAAETDEADSMPAGGTVLLDPRHPDDPRGGAVLWLFVGLLVIGALIGWLIWLLV